MKARLGGAKCGQSEREKENLDARHCSNAVVSELHVDTRTKLQILMSEVRRSVFHKLIGRGVCRARI